MISVKIVCVGNLKEKFWIDACEEYKKRLSRFCKLTMVEIEEQNKYNEVPLILKREGELVAKNLTKNTAVLAIEGKQHSSEEFAAFLSKQGMESGEITFVIGGSYGIDDEIKKSARHKISFGRATYPHNLARVMLLEQIYRGFMINEGSSYHK